MSVSSVSGAGAATVAATVAAAIVATATAHVNNVLQRVAAVALVCY